MKQNFLEFILGLAVLGVTAICLYFFIINNKTAFDSNEGLELIANFDQVNGLKSGSLVKISGIAVGYVKSLSLNQNTFEAKVFLNIDSSLLIPVDTEALVEMDGIFGDTFITLVPGGADENLAQGQEIMLTQGAPNLLSLLSTFAN